MASELLSTISSYFWSEWFWMPSKYSWKNFETTDRDIFYPKGRHVIYLLPLSILLCVVRKLFERYIATPLGKYLGLNTNEDNIRKATPNVVLEKFFCTKKKPTNEDLQKLSAETGSTRRQIERWFRYRRNQDRTKTLNKFTESSWRFLFYFLAFWYGIYVLIDKSWVYDREECWRNWPHHIPNDILWYYALEAGFYLSLLFSIFSDVKRKDFNEMVLHHLCTLGLMFYSYCGSLTRVGSLVLVVHDTVDSWLEAAKMTKYLATVDKRWQPFCDVLFGIFTLIWIATRMILFPLWIIYNTMFVSLKYFDVVPIYFLFNFLLVLLYILHIFWFVTIVKIATNALRKGGIEKDARSDSDMELSDSDFKKESKPVENGVTQVERRVTRQNARIAK